MDLTHIDELRINGKRVVSISSDVLGGYVWNQRYVLGFYEPEQFGETEITSYSMYHGIDNVFPSIDDPTPPEGYDFDGWNPELPEQGSTVLESQSFVASYVQQDTGNLTKVRFVDKSQQSYNFQGVVNVTSLYDAEPRLRPSTDKTNTNPTVNEWSGFQIEEIDFGTGVIQLNQSLFYRCPTLKKVTIADEVQAIGQDAFRECAELSSISLPNQLTSIGNSTFRGCSRLSSIDIPPTLGQINTGLFTNCRDLTSIEIPYITNVANNAFLNCSSLISIDMQNVMFIGMNSFKGCNSLSSINIPNVASIGSDAFYNCLNLSSVTLPDTGITFPTDGTVFGNINSNCMFYIEPKDIENPQPDTYNRLTGVEGISQDKIIQHNS